MGSNIDPRRRQWVREQMRKALAPLNPAQRAAVAKRFAGRLQPEDVKPGGAIERAANAAVDAMANEVQARWQRVKQ
jgi:hypothetical protein